jgi:site-specific recombinase XerD
MQREPTNPMPATAVPTTAEMLRVWRADRCVQDSSAGLYLQWVSRFRAYCIQRGLDERAELTVDGARRFIASYARRRHLDPRHLSGARTALYALSRVYQVMGLNLPAWQAPPRARPPAPALLRAYADHLARYRGNPEVTVHKKLDHVGKVLEHLARQGKTWRTMTLRDIDGFLIHCARRYRRSTTADIAGSVRSFAGFLLATGRISVDLAESVIAPVQPKHERPRRALPWEDVQRLLRAVDTSSARGLRDHTLLVMMSTYGFGAGEAIGLQLQDIDWNASTLNVVRPKTGVAFTLPLLSAVAKVLARYLRHGRPPHTPTRHLFVQMKMPFGPLSSSSAVRHILIKHARVAGIDAPYLGSHVLRHSNAARQLNLGTRPRVLSDLLGHRDPESISAYVRIATESLREVSLPVPT